MTTATFPTGGRITRVAENYVQRDPLVEVEHQGGRQFYGLVGEGFALVRLEDSRGRATRNRFSEVGPPPPTRNVGQWRRALASDDRLEVLRTLAWMGGTHHAELDAWLREFRAQPAVRARLAELLESRDPWVREEARLALRTP